MSESTRKRLVISTYAVLTLSLLLVFWQAGNFDFVSYDDNFYVYGNPHVLGGLTRANITWAFTTSYFGYWQPLTWLSLMLNCQLFGPGPGWMHLVNVLLHLANTLLLFAVLRKMTGSLWPSAFVAAAFALHPMHVESVAWIAERKDVLSTFFLLLTLVAYTGYAKRPSIFRYLIALALFAIGLMAKPMLVTLPFLLLLLDYWPLNRLMTQTATTNSKSVAAADRNLTLVCLIEKIPFFVFSAISIVITFLTQQAAGGIFDTKAVPLRDRIGNVLSSFAAYMSKMFWPQDLAVFYPAAGSATLWQSVLYALLLIGVTLAVLRFWRSRKYLLVGWFWFVATLVPVIGLVKFTDAAYADRFTYVPYTGLFIMIAWGLPDLLSRLPQRKVALGVSMVVVLTVLGICSHRQVSYWRNSFTLFSHAIEVTQKNYLAYNDRGGASGELGRWQDAIEDFRAAIKVKPDYADAYNNLGVAYNKLGRSAEAIETLSETIRIKPDYAEAYYNRGIAYGQLGRWQEAIEDFIGAIKIKPDYAEAYNGRGGACVALGRWQAAIEDFGKAIKIKPDHAEAYNNLGSVYVKLGRWQEAIGAFSQAIRIDPDRAETYNSRGSTYVKLGRVAEAMADFGHATRLKPDWPDAMNNLAYLIATNPDIKNRDTNEAIRLAARACELTNYGNPVLLGTLAAAYASAARFGEAVDTANKALSVADAANLPQLKDTIRYHLSFYTQGKPYIEPAPQVMPEARKP